MSMKDKRVKSVVESDEENEQGACGVISDSRRFSLAVPEPTSGGGSLDESVDNLSMEVHLGGDSSRHPSEISSVSYQNLLDEGEPSNSIISRRGSDDSLDSYPPDLSEAELPPDDLETFEASDLPLSEHFPMGALQGTDREKSRCDRSSHVSDSSSNISRPHVRLKEQPLELLENTKSPEKNTTEPNVESEEAIAKRSSLEIRNNIPVVGEVKDYEKELNIDFSKVPGHKSTVIGLKNSPGVARRVDIENAEENGKQNEISLSSISTLQSNRIRPKKSSSRSNENAAEVITPVLRNMNIENEYDYVKYARVQQGNSYVGMRLAYSSSSDSLNIKQGVTSETNSREPSPEKSTQMKAYPDLGGEEKVCEELLTEIPLNNSDYPEDKKAFTLSPENTECDSVEVESVTSEGENSTPGFPALEDGLSSSQASDADEGVPGAGSDRSPSKLLKLKQKAAVEKDLLKEDEDCGPKEMDAQAIMDDLKMKREALDMAIADIKSAIQRSKNMSLQPSYPDEAESEESQPIWVKRVNKEAANQIQRRQEEMRRVQEEIERQHDQISVSQGNSQQEKDLSERERFTEENKVEVSFKDTQSDSRVTKWKHPAASYSFVMERDSSGFVDSHSDMFKILSEVAEEDVCSCEDMITSETKLDQGESITQLSAAAHSYIQTTHEKSQLMNATVNTIENSSCTCGNSLQLDGEINLTIHQQCDSLRTEPECNIPDITSTNSHTSQEPTVNHEVTTSELFGKIRVMGFEGDRSENISGNKDLIRASSKEVEKSCQSSAVQAVSNDIIMNIGNFTMKTTVIDNVQRSTKNPDLTCSISQEVNFQQSHNLFSVHPGEVCRNNLERKHHFIDMLKSDTGIQNMKDCDVLSLEYTGAFSTQNRTVLSKSEPGISHNENSYTLPKSDAEIMNIENCDTCNVDRSCQNPAAVIEVSDDDDDDDDTECSESSERTEEEEECAQEERVVDGPYNDDHVGSVRLDGLPRGYDSDDECEDAEGIRYTRRNKGKKYAPLQKDDSLEMGGACGGSRREVAKSNGQMILNKHGSHSGSNGSLAHHHRQLPQFQPQSVEQHHVHRTEAPLSSEESSDIEANINSYARPPHADSDTDEETDRLLQKQYQERDNRVEIPELNDPCAGGGKSEADRRHSKAKEAAIRDPDRPEVLIEGVLFRARYLGSTQLISEGQPSKAMRMMQAQEAVGRIKAPEGENQPSTDVDLFVSTEKIMVLNTDLQEIMMDHSLRTISYIADIGDILVIMARRRLITSPGDMTGRRRRQAKILCHVFESDEAQLIAQSIGQAFQVAYLEFLKANGIEDPGLLKEMDYQDVLNQQEIYGEELNLFANKDFHKEVIVPKSKNEPLGVVIVESGWGSMVPTVVLANMMPTGPAARCGQLNIGDQIISINGISLVGLPLSACQTYIKASRSQTVVKLTVVPCPPVVEVLIKRPDVKYQLGFSVQNGVICSLLRGGIAERGGVRVGHRIIEINNQSVVAVPHEKIVTLLASSVGEIHMKTMPTSIFRLLTGQDVPHYL